HRHPVLKCHLSRGCYCGGDLLRVSDAQRPAAETLHHGLVIDAIAAQVALGLRDVLILEGKLDAKIHVEAALALTDQAEITVVDEDLYIRQPELRTDRQLFHQKL